MPLFPLIGVNEQHVKSFHSAPKEFGQYSAQWSPQAWAHDINPKAISWARKHAAQHAAACVLL